MNVARPNVAVFWLIDRQLIDPYNWLTSVLRRQKTLRQKFDLTALVLAYLLQVMRVVLTLGDERTELLPPVRLG
jgi:hypothetical protein